jgi:two-component system sensor histidine kinase/response regulator
MDTEPNKKIRVLLVDDDEDDYFLIKKVFYKISDSPFTLEWVSSFEQAIAAIEDRAHDIYLIDYRLGEKSGLDLLRQVRPQDRSEPFILLTGAGDRDIERRSMKLAAADYLVKSSLNADLLSRTLTYALQRKQIEDQRLQHLVELNRSKEEFISIASHQLRTPATGVKQYIGMVLEGFVGELAPEQKQMLQKAYQSNERQLHIVSDLLKVAQVDAGKVKLKKDQVKISDLIKDIIREQRTTYADRHQTITFTPHSEHATALIDHDMIRMVCENMIDNASKYSLEHTTVRVTTNEDDKYVYLVITDEGVGIKFEERARLFEKFSRINNPLSTKVGGTGLGLYWAKKIVDLHDGFIKVKSVEGEGTTFTIALPKGQNA